MSIIKIPLRKPDIIDKLTASLSDAEATINALSSPYSNNFTGMVDWLFGHALKFLRYGETQRV